MNVSNNLNRKNKNILLDQLIKKLLVVFFLVLLVAVVISNTLVVQEDELIVIKQLGKIQRIIDKPGLYFKLPLLQSTDTLTKKLANYETQPIKVFSKDKRNLILRNYAVWRITEPYSFIANVKTIGSAEVMLESAVFSAARQEYGNLTYDEIIKGLSTGNDYNENITAAVRQKLQNTGMEIVDIRLMTIELTAEEEEATYSRIKSEREKIAKQYIFMAENEASEIKAEADKQAKIILSEASAAAEKIKGQADAEAAKIYSRSYNRDPEFYKFIRTLESYKKTLKGKSTIVIPIDSPYTKYLIGK